MQRIPFLLMVVALGVALAAATMQIAVPDEISVTPLWILAVSLAAGAVLLFERPETTRR